MASNHFTNEELVKYASDGLLEISPFLVLQQDDGVGFEEFSGNDVGAWLDWLAGHRVVIEDCIKDGNVLVADTLFERIPDRLGMRRILTDSARNTLSQKIANGTIDNPTVHDATQKLLNTWLYKR